MLPVRLLLLRREDPPRAAHEGARTAKDRVEAPSVGCNTVVPLLSISYGISYNNVLGRITNVLNLLFSISRACTCTWRRHLAAPERTRLRSRRKTAYGGERSVSRLVTVARSGSRGWRLEFGIRAGRRRTRALLTRAAAELAPQARPPDLHCVSLLSRTADHAAWRAA